MSTMHRSPLLPVDTFLTLDPERTVAHASLSLTVYLDDPRRWALQWISEVFTSFAARIDPRWLRWYMTSQEARWRPVDSIDAISSALRAGVVTGRQRHLLTVRTADDRGAPRVGFVYREVDPRRSEALAYLQVYFPLDCDPNELLAFAIELAQTYPIYAAVGGYAFGWNPELAFSSFRAIATYTKRFIGVDVQVPEAMAWEAHRALPGVNWLTLLGRTAAAAGLDLGQLERESWSNEIAVLPLKHATLVRAGARPQTGDLNLMEYPAAIAEVAQRLDPFVVADPPSFPGPFSEGEGGPRTADWLHRFAAPERWP